MITHTFVLLNVVSIYHSAQLGDYGYVVPCDSPSSTTTPGDHILYPFTGECPMLGHKYSLRHCQEWDITVMVVLRKKNSSERLKEIEAFVTEVTSKCNSQSTLRYYSPGTLKNSSNNCRNVQIHTDGFNTLIDSLQPEFTWITEENEHAIIDMFEKFFHCEEGRDIKRGGVLYFFTNLKCQKGCAEMNKEVYDLITHQQMIVNRLRKVGYLLKFIYMDSGESGNNLDCNIKSILDYCTENEEVIIAGGSIAALVEYVDALRPCLQRIDPYSSPNYLIFMILIPLFFVLLIITSYCILLFRKRQMKKSLLDEFKLREHNRFDNIRTFPQKLAFVSNTYKELKTAANRQRNSSLEIDQSNLFIEARSMGEGAFGRVYKGILRGYRQSNLIGREVHIEVAVKKLPRDATDVNKLDLFKEIYIMRSINGHPHILSLLGSVSNTHDPIIITEYCQNGDLLHFIRFHSKNHECFHHRHCLDWMDLLSFARQISLGMEHVGLFHLVHRDLAARNIFITHDLVAKIGDFGLCCRDDGVKRKFPDKLAIKWTAIEVLRDGIFSAKSDVWSFGVVLFEIFTWGRVPYPTTQLENILETLDSGERPMISDESLPFNISDLLRDCFLENPTERASFSQLTSNLARLLRSNDEDFGYIQIDRRRSTIQSVASEQIKLECPNYCN